MLVGIHAVKRVMDDRFHLGCPPSPAAVDQPNDIALGHIDAVDLHRAHGRG